jgi:hypothetical protein
MSLEINKNIYEWLVEIRCIKDNPQNRKVNSRKMSLDPRTTKLFGLGSKFQKITSHIVRENDIEDSIKDKGNTGGNKRKQQETQKETGGNWIKQEETAGNGRKHRRKLETGGETVGSGRK